MKIDVLANDSPAPPAAAVLLLAPYSSLYDALTPTVDLPLPQVTKVTYTSVPGVSTPITTSMPDTFTYFISGSSGALDVAKVTISAANVVLVIQSGTSTTIPPNSLPSAMYSTQFAATSVGQVLVYMFSVLNQGTDVLTISSAVSNSGQFYLSGVPATVPPAGSTAFTITFAPTAPGSPSAIITFSSNDPTNPTYAFDVAGTATPEPWQVSGSGVIITSTASPSNTSPQTTDLTDFGTLTSSRTNNFLIMMNGNVGERLESLSVSASSAPSVGSFSIGSGAPTAGAAIAPSLSFPVTFTTNVADGPSSATVTVQVADNAGGISSESFTVRAYFSTPQIVIRGGSSNQVIPSGDTTTQSSDGTLFASTPVGHVLTHTFQVCNTGTATLSLGSSPTSSDASEFSFVSPFPTSVGGSSCANFGVTFSPRQTGSPTSTLTMTSNDLAHPSYTFVVGGTATAELWEIDGGMSFSVQITNSASTSNTSPSMAAFTDFGTLSAPGQAQYTYQVKLDDSSNPIGQTASVTISSSSTPSVGSFTLNSPTSPTFFTSTLQIMVTFTTATSSGSSSATITVMLTNSQGSTTTQSFLIVAAVATPQLEVRGGSSNQVIPSGDTTTQSSDGTLWSGAVAIGQPVSHVFQLCNTGSQPLMLTSVTTGSSDFSLPNSFPASVAANTCSGLTIAFSPQSVGSRMGAIVISSNDRSSPYSFLVAGTASGVVSVVGFGAQTNQYDLSTLLTSIYNGSPIDCSTVRVTSQPSDGLAVQAAAGSCMIEYIVPPSIGGIESFSVYACNTAMPAQCGTVVMSVTVYSLTVTNPTPNINWPMYFRQVRSATNEEQERDRHQTERERSLFVNVLIGPRCVCVFDRSESHVQHQLADGIRGPNANVQSDDEQTLLDHCSLSGRGYFLLVSGTSFAGASATPLCKRSRFNG